RGLLRPRRGRGDGAAAVPDGLRRRRGAHGRRPRRCVRRSHPRLVPRGRNTQHAGDAAAVGRTQVTPVRHARRHTAGAALMFASNGAMLASLLPWYPALIREWGLTEIQFGLIVAAMPAGSLVSSVLPARVVAKWGPSAAVIGGTAVMAALIAAVGWIGGGAALALILFLFGIVDATADVGQNVVGTRVQERAGKSV